MTEINRRRARIANIGSIDIMCDSERREVWTERNGEPMSNRFAYHNKEELAALVAKLLVELKSMQNEVIRDMGAFKQ